MASAFYAMAGLSFLAMILVCLQLPAPEPRDLGIRRMGIIEALRRMLTHRRTGGILLARMATMLIMVPTMAFLPLLMHQWFGSSGMEIGIVIACRTLVNALLQMPFGRMADRRDKTGMLLIGCLVICAVMCLVPLADSFWWLLVLFVLLGMGEAIIWPTLGAFATEEGRQYGQGTMMGVFSLAMSVGVFCGSLGAGFTMDLLGLRWSFFIIGILVLVLTMIATSLIRGSSAYAVPGAD
jgi:MFS family permease